MIGPQTSPGANMTCSASGAALNLKVGYFYSLQSCVEVTSSTLRSVFLSKDETEVGELMALVLALLFSESHLSHSQKTRSTWVSFAASL